VRGREPLWEAHDALLGPAGAPDLEPADPVRAGARELRGDAEAASLPDWRVLDDGKETLESTLLDADPQAVLRMPEDSLWPLILALALTALFVALLFKAPFWAAISAVLVLGAIGGWLWPTAATFPPVRSAA
jgi:hypothetical protein